MYKNPSWLRQTKYDIKLWLNRHNPKYKLIPNLKLWWFKRKQNFPWVTRAWHQKELQKRLLWQIRDHQREMDNQRQVLDDLVTKLIKINMVQDSSPPFDYRLQIQFDSEFVHRAFIRGDDQMAIKMIASRMGHLIERELRTINFVRFRDDVRRY